MIERNVLKFGYGDIAVGSCEIGQIIRFVPFESAINVGENVPEDVKFAGAPILFQITYEEYVKLMNNLENIRNKRIQRFYFREYTFDFLKYDEASIDVIEKHLKRAMTGYFMTSAC